MKVLHIYRSYFPETVRGIPEAIRQIALGTKALGVESSIFVLSKSSSAAHQVLPEGGIFRERSWISPASCDIGALAAIRTFARLAATSDVIHYHLPWPYAHGLDVLVRPEPPAVATWHSDVVRQRLFGRLIAPLTNTALQRISHIAATSEAYAKSSPTLARSDISRKVRAIPLGMAETDSVLAARRTAKRAPFFLFLGALNYYKGLPFLLEAAEHIGAHVLFAGDGPDRTALQLRARRLRRAKVEFLGHISDSDKYHLLASCSALILPSHLRAEAFGMVLLEASMCGTPMITCETGTGTSFVNEHGVTGLVVPPADVDALAAAMQQISSNRTQSDAFGRAARHRYEALFSGAPTAEAYRQLYRDALGGRAA